MAIHALTREASLLLPRRLFSGPDPDWAGHASSVSPQPPDPPGTRLSARSSELLRPLLPRCHRSCQAHLGQGFLHTHLNCCTLSPNVSVPRLLGSSLPRIEGLEQLVSISGVHAETVWTPGRDHRGCISQIWSRVVRCGRLASIPRRLLHDFHSFIEKSDLMAKTREMSGI